MAMAMAMATGMAAVTAMSMARLANNPSGPDGAVDGNSDGCSRSLWLKELLHLLWQNTFSWLMQYCGRLSRLGVLFAYTSVETKHDIFNAFKHKNMPRKKTYEIFSLTADRVTAIADNICANIEAFDGNVIGSKLITFACTNASLVMKYVWLAVLHALHTSAIFMIHSYKKETLTWRLQGGW